MTAKFDFIKQMYYTITYYCFQKIGVIFMQIVRHEVIKVIKMNPEENIPKFNEQKTTEAASLLLLLNGGEMNYMKLIKLLYIIDKKSLLEKERPITNDIYYSMKGGQVLSTVLDFVKNKKNGKYWHQNIALVRPYTVGLINKEIHPSKLSRSDIDIIKSIYRQYGKFDQYYLGRLTKEGTEYKQTNKRIYTPIEDVFNDLGFHDKDIIEIKKKLLEDESINAIFES